MTGSNRYKVTVTAYATLIDEMIDFMTLINDGVLIPKGAGITEEQVTLFSLKFANNILKIELMD